LIYMHRDYKKGAVAEQREKKQSFRPLRRWKKALFCCRINLQ